MRKYLAAIWSAPAEGVVRDAIRLAPAQLVGNEVAQASRGHQRGQGPGEAERVGQPHHVCLDTKFMLEIARTDEHLASERLTVWQVAVRFDRHPAHRLPTTLLHSLANTF